MKIINGKVFQTLLHYFKEYFGVGVYKIFLDPTPKIKIIIHKVFEHYSITFKNIWGGADLYKIFLDSKNMIGNKVCPKTALYRC